MTQNKEPKGVERQFFAWAALGISLLLFGISWTFFSFYVGHLEAAAKGHSLVKYINASAQRLVKLELMGTECDELIFNMEITIDEITPKAGKKSEYFNNQDEILQGISDTASDWERIEAALAQYRKDGDSAAMIAASERLFYHAANLSNITSDYISELSSAILWLQMWIVIQTMGVSFIVGHRMYVTYVELKRNRALSASMSIDTATGLFNRSKCHEVLRTVIGGTHPRVMMVFDLNDLKKTNDQYGHHVGDELIQTFATLIKDGSKVHKKDVFIGRYGGDEFMVYYNNINADELRLYLHEVAFLTEAFNEKETRFQVSYAVGYAISTREAPGATLRQLFDIADKNMYRNKAEMKRKIAAQNAALQESTAEGQVIACEGTE